MPWRSTSSAGSLVAASLAASSASFAAWTEAASSRRWRSVFASDSALAADFAALLPLSVMSLMRRIVSSWRWPFLTRVRALGRYLNEMSLGPRSRRTISALTAAPSTTGWPIEASSPSATSSTRSSVTVLPGSASSSSTSSSVPTSTRYCFPPVSMTAYMDPQDAGGGGTRPLRDGQGKTPGRAKREREVYDRTPNGSIERAGPRRGPGGRARSTTLRVPGPAQSASAATTSSGRPVPSSGWNRVRVTTVTGGPSSIATSISNGRRSYSTLSSPSGTAARQVRRPRATRRRPRGAGRSARPPPERPGSRPRQPGRRGPGRPARRPARRRDATRPARARSGSRAGARRASARSGRRR